MNSSIPSFAGDLHGQLWAARVQRIEIRIPKDLAWTAGGCQDVRMRLRSLHPDYLDPRGLVALWRESLLAQAVLKGATRGYRHHPQLLRFQAQSSPVSFIAEYLRTVHAESVARGYRFDASKIAPGRTTERIDVTSGQIIFEWRHLIKKLDARSPGWRQERIREEFPLPHPLSRVTPGGVEDWERI